MKPNPTGIRRALFGGTFDPIHDGHLALAAAAREEAALDEVVFLPCLISPHKTGVESAPAEARLEMCRLATAGLPWAKVSSFDLERPAPSMSWVACQHFNSLDPEGELFWILGADQWQVIEDWARSDDLRRLATFLVFSREGSAPPQARAGWRARFLSAVHPARATSIRAVLACGENPAHLPPAVLGHIRRFGLYGSGKS